MSIRFPELRLLDANANRAREGLRVLEDIARLGLGNRPLCARVKALRHDLKAALDAAGVDGLALLAHRDTAGDVGTDVTGSTEGKRAGLRDIAAAAGKRVAEALRVIEEVVKIASVAEVGGPTNAPARPRAWEVVEAIRYRAYDVERDLLLAMGTGRSVQWRLCVLLTESLCLKPWEEVAAAALEGGADCLQLREKSLSDGELLKRAKWLVELAKGRAAVIVNDRPDIALLAGADGVHLGQDDLPVASVRALAGERLLVGVSTHDLGEARAAAHAGADYCGVGAMFATATKLRETSGVDYLRTYLADDQLARRPHLAIGGITPENIGQLMAAGCRGVAVSGVVCGREQPAEVCKTLLEAMASVT